MEEFGRIDNQTGISTVKTSELFASFITGKTYEDHGAQGLKTWTHPAINRFENAVADFRVFKKFFHLREAIWESINRLNAKHRYYKKDDLQCQAIFDKLDNTKALFVPGYNPSKFFIVDAYVAPLNYGADIHEVASYYEREYRHRRRTLFDELEKPPYDLMMCHFHKPDIWQHLYANDGITHPEKIETMYQEIDALAADIIERANKYDWLFFMSDHGLPIEMQHNENAFYSSNIELGLDEPHITDFHDIILERTETAPQVDLQIDA